MTASVKAVVVALPRMSGVQYYEGGREGGRERGCTLPVLSVVMMAVCTCSASLVSPRWRSINTALSSIDTGFALFWPSMSLATWRAP